MAQDRTDNRPDDDAPVPGVPRSGGEWAKATAKSPNDFPDEEAASAAVPKSGGKKATEAELEAYRRQKDEERRRMEQPARAERDPGWQDRNHLDPRRGSRQPGRGGAVEPAPHRDPGDAEGQAERGTIDQPITDKGYTQTR